MALTALSQAQGLQAFVDESSLLVASNSMGAGVLGGSGIFRSQIIGRASISDLSQNLRPAMGIERVPTPAIVEIMNEAGPSGERVYGVLNDTKNLVRFVGQWSNTIDVNGHRPSSGTTSDFVEITFYGTGLNVLLFVDSASRTWNYSVDGNTAQTGSYPASASSVIESRNYNPNVILPVVSGLALGIHTIKYIQTGAAGTQFFGYEVLNESSSLKINPGSAFAQGKKISLASQSVQAYNSGFTNVYGSVTTKGGRVLVYLDTDGTVKKDIQYVPSAESVFGAADHTNEEVARVYHPREFGGGRFSTNDDFSVGVSTVNRSFLLEDGSTNLLGDSVQFQSLGDSVEGCNGSAGSGVLIIYFVGTGLDIVLGRDNSFNRQADQVFIDSTSNRGVLTKTANTLPEVRKIVSGLPYGSHTIRFSGNATACLNIQKFIVYQPKKPVLPSGAIELADYNILADFVINTTADIEPVSQGVLRKVASREFTYVGTWSHNGFNTANIGGFEISSSTSGSYIEYTFFGTGFHWRGRSNTGFSATNTVALQNLTAGGSLNTLNSTNFPGLTTQSTGGFTFTYASGNLSAATANNSGAGFSVTGLTLGLYKIRLTNNTSSALRMDALDIVTPIHSHDSDLYMDLQNSLPVGSQGISDNRATSPIQSSLVYPKAWAQARGVTSNPTVNVTGAIPMPDMNVTITLSKAGSIEIAYSVTLSSTSAGPAFSTYIFVNGQQIAARSNTVGQNNFLCINSDVAKVALPAGVHTVGVYWDQNSGTITANGVQRVLTVREL